MGIASNIKLRRLELGLTQGKLAEAVGYRSHSAIAKIESGANEVPLSKLVPLARALDTTVERLLAGEDDAQAAPGPSHVIKVPVGYARVGAVILAGGRSTRGLHNVPNQFADIMGKPVVCYCMEAYQRHPLVDDIWAVCLEGFRGVLEACAARYGIDKLRGVLPAGATGAESARSGFEELERCGYGPRDIVVFQESTRPLVTAEMITRAVRAAQRDGSAVTGEVMADNVQFLRDGRGGAARLDRDRVIDLQSPDAHTMSMLSMAFALAGGSASDLVESNVPMLMHDVGMSLNFCEGPHGNVKVVRQEDLAVAAALLRQRF